MVLIVWSEDEDPGLMQAIMTILEAWELINESLRTMVSFEALKGMWLLLESSYLMHSFRARRLLLISAPSSLRCLLLL